MQKLQLLSYALKYQGDYNKVANAINTSEYWQQPVYEGAFFTILDSEYPAEFRLLKDPPFVIFYKGDVNLLKLPKCSIVGSRKSCSYAVEYTRVMSRILSEHYVIVSGLALGIDGIAHETAVSYGKSIGILGCGIDYCYPKAHQLLYDKMSAYHLLISEYPGLISPKKYYFPFRNRLIAALGEFLLVTQAGLRSGTMLTVNEALELGIDIYTIPYALDCIEGAGCNQLLEQGAQIILSYSDLKSKLVDKKAKIIQ